MLVPSLVLAFVVLPQVRHYGLRISVLANGDLLSSCKELSIVELAAGACAPLHASDRIWCLPRVAPAFVAEFGFAEAAVGMSASSHCYAQNFS